MTPAEEILRDLLLILDGGHKIDHSHQTQVELDYLWAKARIVVRDAERQEADRLIKADSPSYMKFMQNVDLSNIEDYAKVVAPEAPWPKPPF